MFWIANCTMVNSRGLLLVKPRASKTSCACTEKLEAQGPTNPILQSRNELEAEQGEAGVTMVVKWLAVGSEYT